MKQRACVVPFPQNRRATLIARAARRMRSMRPEHAESYLLTLLELVQEQLLEAGIAQPTIDDQLIALARAIKAEAYDNERRQPGGFA